MGVDEEGGFGFDYLIGDWEETESFVLEFLLRDWI